MSYHEDREITKDQPGYRRILAFLTPARASATVWFTQTIDLTDTLPWLERAREESGRKLTFLHIFMAAVGRMFHDHPGINRYVTGTRIWQRSSVTLTISTKKALVEGAKVVMLKVPVEADDVPTTIFDRFGELLGEGRSGKDIAQEKEVDWFLKLPAFILRPLIGVVNWLDRRHWLPGFFVDPDPMFTSMVIANLGSVGLNAGYHHLYEYGNSPFFAVIGRVRDEVVPVDGVPAVRTLVDIKYTFDERIEDGLTCAIALAGIKELIEDPNRFETGITDHAGRPPQRV